MHLKSKTRGILTSCALVILLFSSCGESKEQQAADRIYDAIGGIVVEVDEEPPVTLKEFLNNPDSSTNIKATVGFATNLAGVHDIFYKSENEAESTGYDDFSVAYNEIMYEDENGNERFHVIDRLYEGLAVIFAYAKNTVINITNKEDPNKKTLAERFPKMAGYLDFDPIPIDIWRFVQDSGKTFKLITDFGNVSFDSGYFIKEDGGEYDSLALQVYKPKYQEDGSMELNIEAVDANGETVPLSDSNQTYQVEIPTGAEIMKGKDGSPFNLVQYIDETDPDNPVYETLIPDTITNEDGIAVFRFKEHRLGKFRLSHIDDEAVLASIMDKINTIEVVPEDGTSNSMLVDFITPVEEGGVGKIYDNAKVVVDFRELLLNEALQPDVGDSDIIVASQNLDLLESKLYESLAEAFKRVNNKLTIEIKNTEAIDQLNISDGIADKVGANKDEVKINISRFMQTQDKTLILDTPYGILKITSAFFYGKDGIAAKAEAGINDLWLVLRLEKDKDGENPTISVLVTAANGFEYNAEHPGESFHLTIPPDAGFLTAENGFPLYNAVEYTAIHDEELGTLPRSFLDSDDNLHVFANRTGKFKLADITDGDTRIAADFLKARGIRFSETTYVTRGEFWFALMNIHWPEGNFHPNLNLPNFPGYDANSKENLMLKIGQALDAHNLVGYDDGEFRPNENLQRGHLFKMLAGYVSAFSLDVKDLMPANANFTFDWGNEPDWCQQAYTSLHNENFVPYPNDGLVTQWINTKELVTTSEAVKIIYTLITTRYGNADMHF